MRYISLGSKEQFFSLKEVLFKGLAPDGSLFMPESVPILDEVFINSFHKLDLPDIAFHVLKPYMQEDISDEELWRIVEDTFTFDIPLKKVEDGIFSLELFHGPTHAFKDVGARFLSRLLGHFNKGESRKLLVLTATSGDTGGAVAHGFHRIPGIEVIVLYPNGKISPYQEFQITGPGENVHAIAVEGSFDDCQRLVKDAFNDGALREKIYMTSANSINMGRLLPQMVYYFHAVALLRRAGLMNPSVLSVPSGNFGNITAAMLANKMGLPVKRFIAATNANDVVPRFLSCGEYDPHETIVTLANAMDVGDPSNFCRMFDLYNDNLQLLKGKLVSFSISDELIKDTIKAAYSKLVYLMDPHTASAYAALKKEKHDDETGVFVSTAHPFKFGEIIEDLLPGAMENSGYSIDFELDKSKCNDIMMPIYDLFKLKIEKLA